MKVFSIAKYDMIKMFRDRGALIVMLLLPMIFTFVMSLVFNGMSDSEGTYRIPVGIVDLDRSNRSEELLREIEKDTTIRVTVVDEARLFDGIGDGSMATGLIIASGFEQSMKNGQSAEIKVVKLASSVDYLAVQSIVNAAFTRMTVKSDVRAYLEDKIGEAGIKDGTTALAALDKSLDAKLAEPAIITVKSTKYAMEEKSNQYDAKAQSSIGFMVMFVAFAVVLGAGEILEEKKINTWGRLNMSPTSRATIMAGKVVGTFAKGWFQVAFLILFGRFVMGVRWGNSIGATIILASAFLFSVTGLGMFLACFVNTNAQLGAFSSIVVMCTTMMSGCWWPIEMEPLFMQKIAVLFPQYWAVKGFTNTVVGNLGVSSIVTPSLVLAVIGSVLFLLSIFAGGFGLRSRRAVPAVSGWEKAGS